MSYCLAMSMTAIGLVSRACLSFLLSAQRFIIAEAGRMFMVVFLKRINTPSKKRVSKERCYDRKSVLC